MRRIVLASASVLAAAGVAVPLVLSGGAASAGPAKTSIPSSPLAGYAQVETGPASVTTTVVVPTASCTSPSYQAVNVGPTLFDTGGTGLPVDGNTIPAASATVEVLCSKGDLQEFVTGTSGLGQFRFPVAAGDSVQLTVSQSSSGTSATATDVTSGQANTASSPGGQAESLQVGLTGSANAVTILNGATLNRSATSIDGVTLDSNTVPPSAQRFNLMAKNVTLATTSAALAGSFTVSP